MGCLDILKISVFKGMFFLMYYKDVLLVFCAVLPRHFPLIDGSCLRF